MVGIAARVVPSTRSIAAGSDSYRSSPRRRPSRRSVDVVDNGRILRGKVAHRDPEKAALAGHIRCFSPEREDPRLARELLGGAAFILESVDENLAARSVMMEDADFRVRWIYNARFGEGSSAALPCAREFAASPELVAVGRRVFDTGEGASVAADAVVEGERRHLIFHYEPLRRGDTIVGITGSAIDITDAKEAQEELARAVAFRERIMGVLGHDLRNPLNMVQMQAQLLQRQAGTTDPIGHGLQRIVRAADRMDEMIGTLLDVTRLRAGNELRLSVDTVDLGMVVHAVVDELRVGHRGRRIDMTTHGELRGRWDAARIAQVVSNLVANALTHGSLDAPVELSLWEEGASVAASVTNRGPTIPEDALAHLFDPFWQAPTEGAARRQDGLGLGLYIVREIVGAHRGTINVQSRDGITTFTVRLPRSLRPTLDAFDAAPWH